MKFSSFTVLRCVVLLILVSLVACGGGGDNVGTESNFNDGQGDIDLLDYFVSDNIQSVGSSEDILITIFDANTGDFIDSAMQNQERTNANTIVTSEAGVAVEVLLISDNALEIETENVELGTINLSFQRLADLGDVVSADTITLNAGEALELDVSQTCTLEEQVAVLDIIAATNGLVSPDNNLFDDVIRINCSVMATFADDTLPEGPEVTVDVYYALGVGEVLAETTVEATAVTPQTTTFQTIERL